MAFWPRRLPSTSFVTYSRTHSLLSDAINQCSSENIFKPRNMHPQVPDTTETVRTSGDTAAAGCAPYNKCTGLCSCTVFRFVHFEDERRLCVPPFTCSFFASSQIDKRTVMVLSGRQETIFKRVEVKLHAFLTSTLV